MQYVDFTELNFVSALRAFLGSFKLPGEAQQIDRLMENFAARFCQCNPTVFQYQDTCYMLAFSTIMLNTDLHNPAMKDSARMTMQDWLNSNRRLETQEEISTDFLKQIYNDIKENEIKMESHGVMFGSAEKKGILTKQGGRVKTWKKRYFILTHNCLYYFKQKEDQEPCGMIPLENLSVRKHIKGKKNCFEIYDPKMFDNEAGKKLKGKAKEEALIKACKKEKEGEGFSQGHHVSYIIQAEDPEEMQEWIDAIQRNILGTPVNKLLRDKAEATSKGKALQNK